MEYEQLTDEQKRFIDRALEGRNILVDACIGSGKTTAIQTLCNKMRNKKILYLTYNKLLKLDAQRRIQNAYVDVTNYHGFGWRELNRMGIHAGISDIIQTYNREKPTCPHYDVLVLDEYQDIEEEITTMLLHIKASCPGIQLIAVGDMAQKIYNKTRLDVQPFIREFLDSYIPMEFTQCFRLGTKHAAKLGRIWDKTIVGTNSDFKVSVMYEAEIRKVVRDLKPSQLLVLGKNNGDRTKLQNYLEDKYPDVFNKYTVWSKISDRGESTSPTPDAAIFTTYDGCKGMERDVCVLYDWSINYWDLRLDMPEADYEILRNVFCVAASRGKHHLIIAKADDQLTERELQNPETYSKKWRNMAISEMFDFKFIEDVEAAYNCLNIQEIQPIGDVIDVPISDGLIDLSFCIGHYQEAMYFDNYCLDDDIEFYLNYPNRSFMRRDYQQYGFEQKILYLAMLETMQQRYCSQVVGPLVTDEKKKLIVKRLSEYLPSDTLVQQPCSLFFDSEDEGFEVNGILDALKDNIIYELKFVSELTHVHALQMAMYLVSTHHAIGRLWNVRTNQMLEIRIPDVPMFLDKVAQAITKGSFSNYMMDIRGRCEEFITYHMDIYRDFLREAKEKHKISKDWIEEFFLQYGLQLPVSTKDFVQYVKSRRRKKTSN